VQSGPQSAPPDALRFCCSRPPDRWARRMPLPTYGAPRPASIWPGGCQQHALVRPLPDKWPPIVQLYCTSQWSPTVATKTSYSHARQNLAKLWDKVEDSREAAVIQRRGCWPPWREAGEGGANAETSRSCGVSSLGLLRGGPPWAPGGRSSR
jgi:hypothetical protein